MAEFEPLTYRYQYKKFLDECKEVFREADVWPSRCKFEVYRDPMTYLNVLSVQWCDNDGIWHEHKIESDRFVPEEIHVLRAKVMVT